jgi:hypothetical protein
MANLTWKDQLTCTPECRFRHHSLQCMAHQQFNRNRMELEARRLEEFYRYTPAHPIVRDQVASNFTPKAWSQRANFNYDTLVMNGVDLEYSILGVDPADPNDGFLSMEFINRIAQRPGLNGAAVAEMPAPIKKPERDEILRREPIRAEDMPADVDAMQADLAMEAETLLGYSVMRTRLKLQDPLLALLAQLEIEPYAEESVAQYKNEMLVYAQNEAQRMDVAEGINPHSLNARRAMWKTTSLNRYGKPIPEYALDKARQIARACPKAEFDIEELTIIPDPFLVVRHARKRCYIEVWDEPLFEAKNLQP